MNFFSGTFMEALPVSVQLILITLVLVGILYLVFWILRKSLNLPAMPSHQGNTQTRLAVVDAANVDGKRRLVIVRRDNVEHLVMIGGSADLLIEGNIQPNYQAQAQYNNGAIAATTENSAIEQNVQNEDELPDFENLFDSDDAKQIAAESQESGSALSSWKNRLYKSEASATATASATAIEAAAEQQSADNVETGDAKNQFGETGTVQEELPMPNLASALDKELSVESGNSAPDPGQELSEQTNIAKQPEAAEATAKPLPNKQDMEDEMQRLLNELSGDNTPAR